MMQDFYAYIQGTKKNSFSYEHEYLVQKVLYKAIGINQNFQHRIRHGSLPVRHTVATAAEQYL